jgi:hypothetical protein
MLAAFTDFKIGHCSLKKYIHDKPAEAKAQGYSSGGFEQKKPGKKK